MVVTNYRICGFVWAGQDHIFIKIKIDKQLINAALIRLKAKDKGILNSLKIYPEFNEIQFDGTARTWQKIEDVFPKLSDLWWDDKTERAINDPSLKLYNLDRKKKKFGYQHTIINNREYIRNSYLGIL